MDFLQTYKELQSCVRLLYKLQYQEADEGDPMRD